MSFGSEAGAASVGGWRFVSDFISEPGGRFIRCYVSPKPASRAVSFKVGAQFSPVLVANWSE
jgi:hypothetical protein